jgi:hypothetical protein
MKKITFMFLCFAAIFSCGNDSEIVGGIKKTPNS